MFYSISIYNFLLSTVQNILFRLALSQGLDAVLPRQGNVLMYPKFKLKTNHILAEWHRDFLAAGEYDLLAQHARFDRNTFR